MLTTRPLPWHSLTQRMSAYVCLHLTHEGCRNLSKIGFFDLSAVNQAFSMECDVIRYSRIANVE